MFTISFKASSAKLASVLEALQPIAGSVTVTADSEASERPTAAIKAQVARYTTPKTKRSKPDDLGGMTKMAKSHQILENIGTQQFTSKTYLERTEKHGITRATAYAAIREALAAGTLKRLEPGIFQKTGAAFAESLGLQEAQG